MNRSTMTLFPSINQVTKFAAIHRLVVLQRQVPQFLTVAKVVEVPLAQLIGKIMDVPVIMPMLQRFFPQIQIVVKDDESPARAIHRQICGRACDQAVGHVTGPSDSDCGKDGGSPAHAVDRRNSLTSAEQEELRSLRQRFRDTAPWSLLAKQEDAEVLDGLENVPKESIHERIVEQRQYIDKVVDVPVVQSLQEHVEVAKTFPQGAPSRSIHRPSMCQCRRSPCPFPFTRKLLR